MRKVLLLAAMLAMVLAATAPAFAQAVAGDVQYVDCSQVQAAAAAQNNEGDATAGNLGSAAAIDQSQVNACWGGVAAGEDIIWWW